MVDNIKKLIDDHEDVLPAIATWNDKQNIHTFGENKLTQFCEFKNVFRQFVDGIDGLTDHFGIILGT